MSIKYPLKEEMTQDLKRRVVHHKQRFKKLFYGRYRELLPSLIVYENGNATSINFLKMEVALRNNYHVVIGKAKNDKIMILGYITNPESSENYDIFKHDSPYTIKDINFIIKKDLIPTNMKEITYHDDCKTGEFIVIKNKVVNYISDLEVLKHYTDELAEIVLSRFSISMQSKINTFFMSETNDETVNQIANELYNGSPYIKLTKLFDPKDNIFTINNEHLASSFTELKREYQNKISELNNMLGINSLAVEKTSGVSDTEAKSNRAYTTSNANIYLSSRNDPLEKLNRRFGLNIEAIYNDEVSSEFSEIAYSSDDGESKGMIEGE